MQIGRRLYYDKNGNVIKNIDWRQGEVFVTDPAYDIATYPELNGLDPNTASYLDIAFQDRESEFINAGSVHVDPATLTLTIYPRLTITTDQASIPADGMTTATITASQTFNTADTDPVNFTIDGGTAYPVEPANGMATFKFNTKAAGTFVVSAQSAKYGTASVSIQGV